MTFKIYGYGLSPVNLSNEERAIGLPDVDTPIAAYNKAINGKASKISEKPAEKKPACEKPSNPFEIQSVLSNRKKNAFTVVWADGTTTVVHCQPGDKWDDEKALAMCFAKKALGNKGNFNDKFNDALDNKMKIIPGGAGIVSEEKEEEKCNCNPPCEKCKCKEESEVDKALAEVKKSPENASTEGVIFNDLTNAFGINKQTADELAKTALKASNSLKEMIEKLTNDATDCKYHLFIKQDGTITPAGHYKSPRMLKQCAKYLATELFGREPHYYRLWMENGRTVIDFGSYSKFLVLEGITPEDWNNN